MQPEDTMGEEEERKRRLRSEEEEERSKVGGAERDASHFTSRCKP